MLKNKIKYHNQNKLGKDYVAIQYNMSNGIIEEIFLN
jgi:hypothetical protein